MKYPGTIAILLTLLIACQTAPGDHLSTVPDDEDPRQVEETDQKEPMRRWWEPEVAEEEKAIEEESEEEIDATRLAQLVDDPERIGQGAELYAAHCAACHGLQGEGGIGSALNDGYWEHGSDPIDIYLATWDGLPAMGMPSYSDMMNPEDVAAMVAFMLHEFDPNYP